MFSQSGHVLLYNRNVCTKLEAPSFLLGSLPCGSEAERVPAMPLSRAPQLRRTPPSSSLSSAPPSGAALAADELGKEGSEVWGGCGQQRHLMPIS